MADSVSAKYQTPECSHSGVFGFRALHTAKPANAVFSAGLPGRNPAIDLSAARFIHEWPSDPIVCMACAMAYRLLEMPHAKARSDMEAVQAPVPKAGSVCARRCPGAFAEGRWRPQGLGVAIRLQRQAQQEISPGSGRIAQRSARRVALQSRWRPGPHPTASAHRWAMREPATSTRARVDGAAAAVSVRRRHPAADAIRATVRLSP